MTKRSIVNWGKKKQLEVSYNLVYLNVDVLLGRSFKEFKTQLVGELFTSFIRDDTLVFHIALVSHKDNLGVIPRISLDLSTPKLAIIYYINLEIC